LGESDVSGLADIASGYIAHQGSDSQIRTVIVNIHRDHPAVEALHQRGDLGHAAAWRSWMGQARAILRRANLDWARDGAVDLDDLAQIALLELARALPGFRYQSRFSTWAYQVITRGVQRHLRDMSAQKRAGEIDSETDPQAVVRVVDDQDLPAAQAENRQLTSIVVNELTTALGQRNTEVFRLWACDDLSAEMIGQRVGLSVARVYAIISQARMFLRGQATIRGWGELPSD